MTSELSQNYLFFYWTKNTFQKFTKIFIYIVDPKRKHTFIARYALYMFAWVYGSANISADISNRSRSPVYS